jgi:hypothetical protein
MLGGVRKSDGTPNTNEERYPNEYAKVLKNVETRNLQKSVLTSKVVNPFTRALEPPFIGRRRDFYIPRLTSNVCLLHLMICEANFTYLQVGH